MNVGSDGAATAAPSGANQTVVEASSPARYTSSDTPTFTRDVDVLVEGHSFSVSADFGHLK